MVMATQRNRPIDTVLFGVPTTNDKENVLLLHPLKYIGDWHVSSISCLEQKYL